MITARILLASLAMATLVRILWAILDALLGRSLLAEVVSVGVPLVVGGVAYGRMVLVDADPRGEADRGAGTRPPSPSGRLSERVPAGLIFEPRFACTTAVDGADRRMRSAAVPGPAARLRQSAF